MRPPLDLLSVPFKVLFVKLKHGSEDIFSQHNSSSEGVNPKGPINPDVCPLDYTVCLGFDCPPGLHRHPYLDYRRLETLSLPVIDSLTTNANIFHSILWN